jgi:abhydrolase domain-containing protein 6
MRNMVDAIQDWTLLKGMEQEYRQAGLSESSLQCSFGTVRYLKRIPADTSMTQAVLMLHGATADKSTWVRFSRYLASKLPLLIPDLPGHGDSTADLALSYTIEAQVQRLEVMLAALGVRSVHVIGSSMGGAIALRLAAIRPALVASLVLIGPVGLQVRESWLQQHIRDTGKNPMVEVRNRRDYVAMMRIGMSRPPYMPGFVLSALARKYIARLPVNVKIGADIERDLDQGAILSAVACPVLIVWGSEDKVADVGNAEALRDGLAGSRLVILDGIGHVPMVESPQHTAEICDVFLAAFDTDLAT